MDYWSGYVLLLGGGVGILIALIACLHRTRFSNSILENTILMVLVLFLTFMGLEFYFKVFFAEPDSFDTLARRNWREWYANPKTYNSLGYRDEEWTDDKVAGKIKVMVVGDSFVYGDGIENVNHRFSNRLAQKLGGDYVVFNLGKGGTNTQHHIEAIVNYPYSPDILILSYVFNDIMGAVLERQWLTRPVQAEISPVLAPLVNNSYSFNFLYWRVFHLLQSGQPDIMWDWYLSVYDDPDSWWLHQQQLLSIYEGAQVEQIPLLVVVFPSMNYTKQSQVVTERIISLYKERDIPVLDVANLIEGIPTEELMVSPTDAHPSELVHQLVADKLYEMFVAEGLVK
ncbi:MAG: SGNH/GDSL hydrolase family protein [Anaerolineae bacterium]|nr:SGNH/GDSL hydrolase family protein [Anaerolineae bacterium]